MFKDFSSKYHRILITGGAGFIGSNLISKLLKNTDCVIFNIDKMGYASDDTNINNSIKEDNKENYKLLKIDLVNAKEVDEAFKFIKPDLVMHLAAESHVDRSIEGPKVFLESNIMGTFNLLQSSLKYFNSTLITNKEHFRFHHISTDEVFGSLGNEGSFNEETAYDPRSPYSASKAASDHLVRAWNSTFDLPTIITNCSNNFGPYQYPEKLIPVAILKLLNSEKVPLYGDGKNVRDWLYVDDHINALILVASKGKISDTYCVGGHGEITNKDLILKICSILDKIFPEKSPHNNLLKFVKDRPGHDRRYSIDPTKIKSDLGWKVNETLDKNLRITIEWYIDNLDWCKKILKKQTIERRGLIDGTCKTN